MSNFLEIHGDRISHQMYGFVGPGKEGGDADRCWDWRSAIRLQSEVYLSSVLGENSGHHAGW